ncbi:MAG: exonuclease SbcCD subunit D [Lachnospiraceae bacterium]|nr:exonuclease SbcCD subunit D [Lachnospiraceae bacterium]
MKFLHLADLHIGKSLGDFDFIEDQKFILNQILESAEKNHIHAILIAGDVYDKSVPSESAVRLFDYFICRLAEKEIKAFIISGNHDSDERMNFGSNLFRASNIFISAKYEGELFKQVVEDSNGIVNIYLMPFVKASQVRHFYPEENITTYEDAVRVVLKKSHINPLERNILVAHQFVAGKRSEPQLGGSESSAAQNVGLVEKIGVDCFVDFDYVALGHIHRAQSVEREEIRYAGSPIKYSVSEAEQNKFVTIVDLGKKGDVSIKLEPLYPMRDLRHIKGQMKQLLAQENISKQDDFMYVTLTDEDIIDHAMSIFQQYYPNTIRIEYDNSHTKELQQLDISQVIENKTFSEMISDFYKRIYGCDIRSEELKLMRDVAKEAGMAE